jgi:hypothetical protein
VSCEQVVTLRLASGLASVTTAQAACNCTVTVYAHVQCANARHSRRTCRLHTPHARTRGVAHVCCKLPEVTSAHSSAHYPAGTLNNGQSNCQRHNATHVYRVCTWCCKVALPCACWLCQAVTTDLNTQQHLSSAKPTAVALLLARLHSATASQSGAGSTACTAPCIAFCTNIDSDSHYSSCRSDYMVALHAQHPSMYAVNAALCPITT